MHTSWKHFTLALSAVLCLFAPATGLTATQPHFTGFADDRGGRGGKILRVTNLDAKGPGSLRAALDAKGPRIVVFEVGGVVDLGMKTLTISEPFLTVAGQTAPSPGITLIRGGLVVRTHDVVIRHIRVRPGDAGQPHKSGWEPDGLTTAGGIAYNVVIDHCSFSWAVDENLSASGPRTDGAQATSHRVTFSNCIIAEGLNNASHSKGPHSKGSLVHDFCQDIAIVGNLYAHNMRRNPYFKAHTTGVIVNNLIYNPGTAAIQLNYVPSEWAEASVKPVNCRVSVVGNVLYYGHNTRRGLALVSRLGDAYLKDNVAYDRDGKPAPLVSGDITRLPEKPVWPAGLKGLPSSEVADYILQHAGARPRDRDATDLRIIRDFRERKGRIIDSQNEVGGYPHPVTTQRKLEVPDNDVEGWLKKMAQEIE